MRLRFGDLLINPANSGDFPENAPDWVEEVRSFSAFWFSEQAFWTAQTSGSTGMPAYINLSRSQLLCSAEKSLKYFNFNRSEDGFALVIPGRAAGGFMLLARAFVADMDVLLLPPNCFSALMPVFPEDKKWFLPLLPIQFHDYLAQEKAAEFSQQLSGILLGGGRLENELRTKIKGLHCPVFHSYGMTETASHIAVRTVASDETEERFFPLPGVQVRVGNTQCLEVNAGIITHDKWLVTTDLAEVYPDGSFLIKGRSNRVINSGGLKIHPDIEKEIIRKYISNPELRFDLLGIPDQRLGEKLVMACYAEQTEAETIKRTLKLETNKKRRRTLPREIIALPDGPPLLPGGKTDFITLSRIIQGILKQEKQANEQ